MLDNHKPWTPALERGVQYVLGGAARLGYHRRSVVFVRSGSLPAATTEGMCDVCSFK